MNVCFTARRRHQNSERFNDNRKHTNNYPSRKSFVFPALRWINEHESNVFRCCLKSCFWQIKPMRNAHLQLRHTCRRIQLRKRKLWWTLKITNELTRVPFSTWAVIRCRLRSSWRTKRYWSPTSVHLWAIVVINACPGTMASHCQTLLLVAALLIA